MPDNAKCERNRTLDMIKGLVILSVVVTHILSAAVVSNGAGDSGSSSGINADFLMEFLYSALILFFVISGYCYKPRGYVSNVKRRIIQIGGAFIICTVVLTIIMAGLQAIYGYDITATKVLTDIGRVLIGFGAFTDYETFQYLPPLATYEISHAYYFIEIMLFAFLIFYAIAERSTKNWKTVLVTVFILTSFTFLMREFIPFRLPWFFQNVPMAAAFMVLGLYAKKRGILEYIDSGYREKKYWIILAAVIALASLFIVFFPTRMCFVHSTFGDYGGWSAYTYVILTVLCSYTIAVLASGLARIPKFSNLIIFIGGQTMIIFLLHMFYAKLISMQFHTLTTDSRIPFDSIGEAIIVVIVVIILCIATSIIISKIKEKYIGKKSSDDTDY